MRVQSHVQESSDSVPHERMYGKLESAIHHCWLSKNVHVSRWHALAYAHVYVRGDHDGGRANRVAPSTAGKAPT